HPGDRLQILGLVGKVLVDEGMRGERGRWRGQQHVIVLGGDQLIATSPSPPGRFSTTTGWPQRLLRRSASSRVPISTPLPGPSVTRNFTGRCGQVCAGDGVAETTNASAAARMKTQRSRLRIGFLRMHREVERRVQMEYTGCSKPPVKWVLAHSCGFTLRSSSTPAARTRCAVASSAGGVAPSCIAVAASYNMRRAITIARSVGKSFSFA